MEPGVKDRELRRDQVASRIRELLTQEAYRTGDKLLSERKLAERFEVNHQTVRAALAQLDEEGLIERRRGSGTFVRELPQASRAQLVALVVRSRGHVFADFAGELSRRCHLAGFVPVLLPLDDDGDMAQWQTRLRGLAAMGCTRLIAEPFDRFDAAMPAAGTFSSVVWLWRQGGPERSGHTVEIDDERAMLLAVRHLTEWGHTRFAYLSHGYRRQHEQRFKQNHRPRRNAIKQALVLHGLPPDHPHVFDCRDDAQFAAIVADLLQTPDHPTAFIADSDFRATRLLDMARRHGFDAPRDFSIIGRGDTPWAAAYRLTSLGYDIEKLANAAVSLLALPSGESSHVVRVTPSLVPRASTGPAPDHSAAVDHEIVMQESP